MKKNKILIITGGTGGHVIPALNFFNYLNNDSKNVFLLTDNRGYQYITNTNKKNILKINSSHLTGNINFKLLGLIFCLIILIIILSIVIKTLLKVLKVDNPYKIIAISGLICSFGLQSLINIFSALGMIPTKGMTLPFVSYGGSSMLATSILFGFLLSLTNINNEEE